MKTQPKDNLPTTNRLQEAREDDLPANATQESKGPDPWGPTIQKHIKHLISLLSSDGSGDSTFENSDIASEMIVTALKAVNSHLGRGDLKILSRSIRELRYAFKIFKNYRSVRKVTMFGSARTKSTDPAYKMAKEFAEKLVGQGYMIITGAGPGIMQAGNEGAGPRGSFGVNIRLPYEQFPNEFIAKQPTYIDCRYFFTRKLIFVKEACAGVFFPGGFGTLDEAFELLTLVQTGKCDPIPLVFIDTPKKPFWRDLRTFIQKQLLETKKISKDDVSLYKIVNSVDDAIKEIVHFYSNYHSLRFVKDQLVLRFRHPIDNQQLKHLNKHFKDILNSGSFQRGGPLPEEENQPELQQLPRLIFKFNRINIGRLRELIDFMNR